MALDRRNYRQASEPSQTFVGTQKTFFSFSVGTSVYVFFFFWSPSLLFQLVDTTVELANKVGAAEIISRIVDDLKDEAEQYRKMVMETIEKIMGNLGAADIDHKLEEQLIDGILYAFQEQTTEVSKHKRGWEKYFQHKEVEF